VKNGSGNICLGMTSTGVGLGTMYM